MTSQQKPAGKAPEQPVRPQDAGFLEELTRAEAHLREFRTRWEEQAAENRAMQQRMNAIEEANRQLTSNLAALQERLEEEHRKAESQRERAAQLSEVQAEIHGMMFSGDIYEPILRACLNAAGASRGVYVISRDAGAALQVRAAIRMTGTAQDELPPALQDLCRRVVQSNEPVLANAKPPAQQPGGSAADSIETLHWLAVPVTLQKSCEGVILVGSATHEFTPDDVETLAAVGAQAGVAVENTRLQSELQRVYLTTITRLAAAIEAGDPYHPSNCELASRYAGLTAQRMGLPEGQQSLVAFAALLHDVGKSGVSDGVLYKPTQLLPEELALARADAQIGSDMLGGVAELEPAAVAIRHHHEHWDGTGTPSGLRGEDIPLAARIVAVVDAYCAMISHRSYRPAMPEGVARQEILKAAGKQFDPAVVQAFVQVLDMPAPRADEEESQARRFSLQDLQRGSSAPAAA